MNRQRICIWTFSIFLIGCGNPFISKEPPPFVGVWSVQLQTLEPKTVAFLDDGRYLENNIRVGLYQTITKVASGTTDWIVQVDYDDGERIQLLVVTTANNLEIQISNETGRGPSGVFDRLHSGEGL